MSARIYGDWGSTRLRLWLIRDGRPEQRRDGPGIVGLPEPADRVLADAIGPWLDEAPDRIVLCGMAGARGGLHEVAYADCPADRATWRARAAATESAGVPVRIAAGLACRDPAGRSDVMRGEETQVFGTLLRRPGLAKGERSVVLPGTHNKWVRLADGRVEDFRTFPTGELFALLQRSSLAGAAEAPGSGNEDEGFAEGIELASEDRGLLGSLFHARAGQVRDGRSGGWARGFLSGLLLGSEAAELRRAGRLPDEVLMIGDPALTRRYIAALVRFGVTAETADGEECVLAGLELLDADD